MEEEILTNTPAITISRYNALLKQIEALKTQVCSLERKVSIMERSLKRYNG